MIKTSKASKDVNVATWWTVSWCRGSPSSQCPDLWQASRCSYPAQLAVTLTFILFTANVFFINWVQVHPISLICLLGLLWWSCQNTEVWKFQKPRPPTLLVFVTLSLTPAPEVTLLYQLVGLLRSTMCESPPSPRGKGSSSPGFSSEKEEFASPISRVVKRTQLYINAARHEKLGALFTAYFSSPAHRLLTVRLGCIYLPWGRFWLFPRKDKRWVSNYPGKEMLMSGILFRQVFRSFQRYPWAPRIQRWQSK